MSLILLLSMILIPPAPGPVDTLAGVPAAASCPVDIHEGYTPLFPAK